MPIFPKNVVVSCVLNSVWWTQCVKVTCKLKKQLNCFIGLLWQTGTALSHGGFRFIQYHGVSGAFHHRPDRLWDRQSAEKSRFSFDFRYWGLHQPLFSFSVSFRLFRFDEIHQFEATQRTTGFRFRSTLRSPLNRSAARSDFVGCSVLQRVFHDPQVNHHEQC